MKPTQTALILSSLLVLASGCSKHRDTTGSNGQGSLPSLPASWVKGANNRESIDAPSEAAAKSVQLAFRVHATALDEIAALPSSSNSAALIFSDSHPPDWTPWHLDGMIGSFAVDVGGVFGALIGDGAAGVKVTWQKQKAASQTRESSASAKRTAYHFDANMTRQDVSAMIEPTVRMAIATRSVRDAGALRKNLTAEGLKFLSAVKVLGSVRPPSGWHIDGFQLGLFFAASGTVSSGINVGGNTALYFDWTVPSGSASMPAPALDGRETKLARNLGSFVQTISAMIPEAAAGAADIRKAGFEFQVFQIGLGFSVGGNVGIATASAGAVGRIIFKSNAASSAILVSEHLTEPLSETLNLVVPAPDSQALVLVSSSEQDNVVPIETRRFSNGIRRAIKMGAFFARQAAAADTPTWKTNEIELGFDTNQGGDLGLVTLQGVGLIRIGFERVER